jgi:hypothetical protein
VTVARAKRTARAEARRRYRAEQHLLDAEGAAPDDQSDAGGATTPERRSRPSTTQPMPQGRVGIAEAFRLSFRPLDVRGDLRALPQIAVRSKALWVPLLLTVGSTIAFAVTAGQDIVTQFMFAYFVQTPAIGGVFLAGFLAPRASWLLGVIVGLVAAVCYTLLILTVFAEATATVPEGIAQDTITAAFTVSPVMGGLFAAAAAWYRRFLQLSNPNRGRQAQSTRRGPDGRSRSTGQQSRARR